MNLYEELLALRGSLPEEDQKALGLSESGELDRMRNAAINQLVETEEGNKLLAEDENRSDSETFFFFRQREPALSLYNEALTLGLAPGEVTFDTAVDESYGVGKYAVRFMPHVRTGKREILMHLRKSATGLSMSMEDFDQWLGETDGGAVVVENQISHSPNTATDSSTGDPVNMTGMDRHGKGRAPHGSVHELTKQGGSGSADVHDASAPMLGRKPVVDPLLADVGANAKQTFDASIRSSVTKLDDFVIDGGTGSSGTGPGIANQGGGKSPGHAPVENPSSGYREDQDAEDASSRLSEELKQLCGSSIDELRSLVE